MEIKLIDITGLNTFKEQFKNKLGIKYNNSDKRIYITYGLENISYIDASAFLIDGMLDTVEVTDVNDRGNEGTFIKFTFNTDSGSKVIYLDAAQILKDIPKKIADLEEAMDDKVDKEDGKGLSSNDFTDDYKNKLDNIATEQDIISIFN